MAATAYQSACLALAVAGCGGAPEGSEQLVPLVPDEAALTSRNVLSTNVRSTNVRSTNGPTA